MKLPKIQGPRIQSSRKHRAAAAFVDKWQVRIIAIGPFYLRLSKRPKCNDKAGNQVATAFINSAEMDRFTNMLEGES